MNDLIKQQEELQHEAHQVLDKLGLIDKLSKIGEVTIVGSLELGLMVWRDIDIEVYVEKSDKEQIIKLMGDLVRQEDRVDFIFLDNLIFKKERFPNGLYLGVTTGKETHKIWKIDIWFMSGERATGYNDLQTLKPRLNDENKKIILEIKNALWDHPKYKKVVSSKDIYEAVLDHEVKNLEEFKEYLKTINKEL